MSFWHVIGQNLLGFDLVIFVAAVLNAVCFLFARRTAMELYHRLHLVVFIPSRREDADELAESVRAVDEEQIVMLRKRSEALYTVFVNVTGIFPLLGILGTVISLLPMVADMADMQQNFFAALTSTFWGLVFAIVFKLLDGLLASKIEDNDKNVALLLDRRDLHREAALR